MSSPSYSPKKMMSPKKLSFSKLDKFFKNKTVASFKTIVQTEPVKVGNNLQVEIDDLPLKTMKVVLKYRGN